MSGFMWRLAATVLPALAVGTTAVWLAYSVSRRRRGPEAARLAAYRAVLAVGVATLLWWTLLLSNPNADGARALNLIPFREISRAFQSTEAGYGVVNLLGNIVVFLPVGAFALLSMRATTRFPGLRAFGAGVALSVGIEAAQYVVGRSADIDDVILNAVGIATGVLGVMLVRRIRRRAAFPATLASG